MKPLIEAKEGTDAEVQAELEERMEVLESITTTIEHCRMQDEIHVLRTVINERHLANNI